MALTPLKEGRGEGALRRGNQGGGVTSSTRHLQGAELGGGAVGGGRIWQWCGQTQVMQGGG
jgi:hypothetical protein